MLWRWQRCQTLLNMDICLVPVSPGSFQQLAASGEHQPANNHIYDGSLPQDSESATLYVGGLPPFTTPQQLAELFQQWNPKDVKVVKDKSYGFVTCPSQAAAELAIRTLNGQMVSGGQALRVNYALVPPSEDRERGVSANGEPMGGRGLQPQHQVFVGDLSASVDDTKLYNSFARYTSCVDARVMWDPYTKRSKGFGFVTFTKLEDASRAIAELNGQLLGSRHLRCDWAQHKLDPVMEGMDEASIDRANPTSTNIYVGNISPNLDKLTITALFQEFGKVVFVRVHRKGSYGFVGFQDHWSAVRAILGMHGKMVHDRALKCSWGTMGNFGGAGSCSNSNLISPNTSGSSANSCSLSSGGTASQQYFDLPAFGSRGPNNTGAKSMPVRTYHHSSMMPSNTILGSAGGYPLMASQHLAPGNSTAASNMYAMAPQATYMPAMHQQAQHPYLMPASMLPMAYKPGQNAVSVAKMMPSMPYAAGPNTHVGWSTWSGQGGVAFSNDLLLPAASTGMMMPGMPL